ncbi:MAG: hypothetical protein Q8N03_08640 [Ignavibacteria bacterium]|nr:hypothetical protein [Ignavibacteria bacterium]
MSFSKILHPRSELLKGSGIQGIIDIENIHNKHRKTLESSPEDFFALTYPTTDIRNVLHNLNIRYNSDPDSPGLFLLEGFKGSGKSHLELFVYHLFQNNELAKAWLVNHELECDVPNDATVIIHKFTDFPLDSIWNLIFEKVGAEEFVSNIRPDLNQLREALKGKKVVLILDELELGYQSIANKNTQAQNLSFLQMLSEEAQRSEDASITIFASIYNSNNEPGSTLKRVPRIDVKFSEPKDRKMVVLHRLFSNYGKHDLKQVEIITKSYINQWKKNGIGIDEKYEDRFIESYPFTPEVFDILLNRVLSKNIQGNRGPLALLGRLVKNSNNKLDIISASALSIRETAIRNLLTDLDPGQTFIQCALTDLNDLEAIPMANEIVASTLMGTIASSGNLKGIKEFELARQVIKPGDNYNDYTASINAFEKLGAYFQKSEGSFFFDTQEKPYAKVEYRSLRIDTKDALDFVLERWKKNVFIDTSAIIYRDDAQTKNELFKSEKNSPRFVLAPKRLSNEERKKIFSGIENPNTVLLFEPKSDVFNALDNRDMIKWAQLALAAKELKNSAGDAERKRQYERIQTDNEKYIDDSFRKAGLAYVLVRRIDSGFDYELDSVGHSSARQDVLEQLQRHIFPRQVIEEHISNVIEHTPPESNWLFNHSVLELKAAYRKTSGFPVLLTETIVIDALKNLCQNRTIGLTHTRENYCGRYPGYSGSEWNDVIITEPFVDQDKAEILRPSPNSKTEVTSREGIKSETSNTSSKGNENRVEPLNIYTTNKNSVIELRQEIASKLTDKEDAVINKVTFFVYIQKDSVELNTLPIMMRGQLTGLSDVHFELTITQNGSFSKSKLEQMAEQLPVFQDASYKAELKGFVKSEELGKNEK